MAAADPVANPSYTPLPPRKEGYQTFNSFYPFYLGEHSNPTCRRLHLVGTTVSTLAATRAALTLVPSLLAAAHAPAAWRDRAGGALALGVPAWQVLAAGVAQGYALAWVGHFFFERNRPATFTHPVYSFMGDLRMLWEVVCGRRSA